MTPSWLRSVDDKPAPRKTIAELDLLAEAAGLAGLTSSVVVELLQALDARDSELVMRSLRRLVGVGGAAGGIADGLQALRYPSSRSSV
jgi:hypothetical protein